MRTSSFLSFSTSIDTATTPVVHTISLSLRVGSVMSRRRRTPRTRAARALGNTLAVTPAHTHPCVLTHAYCSFTLHSHTRSHSLPSRQISDLVTFGIHHTSSFFSLLALFTHLFFPSPHPPCVVYV